MPATKGFRGDADVPYLPRLLSREIPRSDLPKRERERAAKLRRAGADPDASLWPRDLLPLRTLACSPSLGATSQEQGSILRSLGLG